jgi:hypothetical protein
LAALSHLTIDHRIKNSHQLAHPLRLKRPDENLPKEFGRALKRELLLAISKRLHFLRFYFLPLAA